MKKIAAFTLAVVAMISWWQAQGQGTVLFDTHSAYVDARVYHPSRCEPLGGQEWAAQLYAQVQGASFVAVGIPVAFGTASEAGYLHGGEVTVSGTAPATTAMMMVRFWQKEFATYEDAASGGGIYGQSAPVQVTLGDANPGRLIGLETVWGGCPSEVRLELRNGDSTVELYWSMQGFASEYVVVPQEADRPLGTWRDIDAPWQPEFGSAYSPNPFSLPKTNALTFYRVRVATPAFATGHKNR